MILVAGLTPAWQRILLFQKVRLGQVNRAHQALSCASGKPVNVARALHALEEPARLLTMIGGSAGEAIQREFDAAEIDAEWIWTTASTRICTTVIDEGEEQTTELVEESPPCSEEELAAFDSEFRELARSAELVVLTGSLPPGTPRDLYARLIEGLETPVVLDVRGPELLQCLRHRPLIVKPNRDELAMTCGCDLSRDDDLCEAMRTLNRQGAQCVVVSDGGHPVWASTSEQIVRFKPPFVEVANPIGCGDCLAAGIAAGWLAERDLISAVRLGIGAATDNLTQLLPARLRPGHVGRLAETVEVDIIR